MPVLPVDDDRNLDQPVRDSLGQAVPVNNLVLISRIGRCRQPDQRTRAEIPYRSREFRGLRPVDVVLVGDNYEVVGALEVAIQVTPINSSSSRTRRDMLAEGRISC